AQRLNECTSDPLGVARLGPNAFGMVSSSSTKEAEFFEMLTECFRKPFLIGDAEVRVSITIGLCTPPAEGGDPDALVSHAETASKIAKTQGRAQLVFADSMSLRVPERVALENNLRRAYEEQEFLLHYQP